MAVYFLVAAANGVLKEDICKIGYMADGGSQTRISNVRTACPFETEVLWVVDGAGKDIEAQLHRLFDEDCVEREWFKFTTELEDAADNVMFALETLGPEKLLRMLRKSKTADDFNRRIEGC